jgi:tetratricopeptide (TPR) repeat protein
MTRSSSWRSIPLAICAALAFALTTAFVARAEPGRRVALVVGNGNYRYVPVLTNPLNDARLIADTLKKLGFILVGGGPQIDLEKPAFDSAVQAFGEQLVGAGVGLFYYAGHGLQVDGTNWLVPVGANPTRPQDLDFEMIDASLVLRQMSGAGTRLNMMILDACRNNPFNTRGLRATGGGLAQMRAPEGTLIAYATQPGNVAHDGIGNDSPFSAALALALVQPGLDVFRLFNQVGLDVKRSTAGEQQPWLSSSPIDGDFYFNSFSSEPVAALAGNPAPPVPQPMQQAMVISPPQAPAPPNQPPPTGKLEGSQATAEGEAAESRGDYSTALVWYRRGADIGDPQAQFDVAWTYQNGLGVPADPAQAVQWYRRAAENGHAMAANNLGVLYKNGVGTERDYAEAMRWYRRAADAGNAEAQNNIGVLFDNGQGVTRDYGQAMLWFRRAADAGNVSAEVNLGVLFQNGVGVTLDYGEAMRWFRRATDAGSPAGETSLGLMYENGLGVQRDHAAALVWIRKAASAGDPVAKSTLASFGE